MQLNMQLNKKKIVRTVLCAVLVGGALGYSFAAKSETKLLPFQGKLTDANGQVIPDKAIVVQFKMYDAPVGGNAKWNGEVQMLTVNGGLVNTTLGTKASLKNVDFSTPTYLEITIDANGDDQIGPEDPPLLPRQSIIPTVYAVQAGDARTLSGYDWSSIFGANDPTGKIPGNKLADGSVTEKQIGENAVTAFQIKAGEVTTDKIAKGAVTSTQLADGAVNIAQVADGAITKDKLDEKAVTTEKIAKQAVEWEHRKPRTVVTNTLEVVPEIGQIAKGERVTAESSVAGQVREGSKVRLNTSGGAVYISLEGDRFNFSGWAWNIVEILRDGTVIYTNSMGVNIDNTVDLSPSAVHCIDYPGPGLHDYKFTFRKEGPYGGVKVVNTRIVAFEL